MLRRAAYGSMALLVFAGCGGRSEKTRGGGETDDTKEPLCRKFAARYTEDRETTCAFDRNSVSLRCEPTRYGVVTTSWATIDDAVDDNHPIGRITASFRSFVASNVTFTDSITYDAVGRPTFSQAGIIETPPVENIGHGTESFEYSAWDAEKRPTESRVIPVSEGASPPSVCGAQHESYEYDDANRRFFVTRVGNNTPLCQEPVTTRTFDEDGILLEEVWVFDGSGTTTRTYTTFETGEICRD